MAIAAAIPIALQIFQAIKQGSQANKMAGDYNRPNMEVPQGMYDALDIKKNLALQTGLPRQDLIEQKLDESSANALAGIKEGATSPWDVIKGAQRVGEVKSEKIKDLGIAGGEYKVNAANDLAKAFEGLAKIQQDQFMFNEYSPYMNAMNTVRGLREASTKNLFSGASNAAGVWANSTKEGNGESIWDSIFGVNKAKSNLGALENEQMNALKPKKFNEIPLDGNPYQSQTTTTTPTDYTELMKSILANNDSQLYNLNNIRRI